MANQVIKGALKVVYNNEIYEIHPKTEISEITDFANASIAAGKVNGTLSGASISGSNVIGNTIKAAVNASSVSGSLTSASIPGANIYGSISNATLSASKLSGTLPSSGVTVPASIVSGTLSGSSINASNVIGLETIIGSSGNISVQAENVIGLENEISKFITYVPYPEQINAPNYDGNEKTVEWANFVSSKVSIKSGYTKRTDAGTYSVVFATYNGGKWIDPDEGDHTVQWKIKPKVLSLPTQSGTLQYNGNARTAVWSPALNTNDFTLSSGSTGVTISGANVSAINAGTHTLNVTPKTNRAWNEAGDVQSKQISFTIGKAAGTITVSSSSVSLSDSQTSVQVTVTKTGDGTIGATPTTSNANVATASYDSSTGKVTITATGSGNATITISVTDGNNYSYATKTKTISVTSTAVVGSSVLNDNTWAVIKNVVASGRAGTLWSYGDTKDITLKSGNVVTGDSNTAVSGTYKAVLVGVDHNSAIEGTKRAHFMILKNSSGNQICFVGSSYNNSKQTTGFIMNKPNTNDAGESGGNEYGCNVGGWEKSYGRRKICAGFYSNILPDDLVAVIADSTKYTDNQGNVNNENTGITATTDKVWFAAEWEIFGARTYANQYEHNKQEQYAYWQNASTKVCKKHTDESTAAAWWERSPYYGPADRFCGVGAGGGANHAGSAHTCGVVPGFTIA